MDDANDTLSYSPTEPQEQMPWLEGTNKPNPQHLSDPLNNLNLQHPSDYLTHRPTRTTGISHFLEARQNTPVTSSTPLATKTMTPQLSDTSSDSPSSPAKSKSPTFPTSPTFSDLTPTPESPTFSPMNMTCDQDGDMELMRSDTTLADPEALPSEMTTAMGGEAEISVDGATDLSQERATEFEEYTAHARDASRKDSETASVKDSGAGDLQHNSPEHLKEQIEPQKRDLNAQNPREEVADSMAEATPSRDQTVSQEHRLEAHNDGEDEAEPKREVTPPRLPAAWVTEAAAACQGHKKNPLNKGTVLIILDPADRNKSCLLNANTLGKTSGVLAKLCEDAQNKSAGCVSEQGQLTALLVLSSTSSDPTPELVAETLDATIESVLPPKPKDTGIPRLTRSAKIKAESDQGDSSSDDDSEVPRPDWPKAYERFFRMLAGKKHGVSKQDLETAFPQIQGVIKVAQRYGAINAVKSTFTDLLLGYVENRTLYSTISKWPSHCLNIGLALESRLVYDEAFKHLVGESANFKEGKPFPDLPDDVQAIVQRRSRELYSARRDVEEKLMLMTLPGTQSGRSSRVQSPPEYPSQYVSQHDQRTAYDTVNVFRDWIMWHIGHLRNETLVEPKPFYLCDHVDGCTHVAGFYQTIAGKDYLDPDEVYDDFDGHYKSARNCVTELEAVRKTLEGLKNTASGYVEKMSESTLHLADRSGLRYLTCVKVETEDVPWAVESEDGDSDQDMDEDSD